jgi:ketosteroid isomerase-like protein
MTGRPRDQGAGELAQAFEAQRPRLVRLAYATTGSLAEAEDCVQETWLRLRRVPDQEPVRDLGAWLTTTVSRLALDALGSARARRERYVGPWLPEPLVRDLDGGGPRFPPTGAQQEELVTAFAAACAGGDLEGLVALLDPDVVWRADGGGKVTATRRVARGADEVARWLLSFTRHPPTLVRMASVNGSPGLVVRDGGGVLTVVAFTVDRGRITALDAIRNPDKLTALPEAGRTQDGEPGPADAGPGTARGRTAG